MACGMIASRKSLLGWIWALGLPTTARLQHAHDRRRSRWHSVLPCRCPCLPTGAEAAGTCGWPAVGGAGCRHRQVGASYHTTRPQPPAAPACCARLVHTCVLMPGTGPARMPCLCKHPLAVSWGAQSLWATALGKVRLLVCEAAERSSFPCTHVAAWVQACTPGQPACALVPLSPAHGHHLPRTFP